MAHAEPARAMQEIPVRLVFAVAVEHLHAMVLAIRDIDPAVGVGADVVHDVELAGTAARAAPREQQLAVGRIFVHARVAVAVADIDVAARRERGVGAAIERLAAHEGRRPARDADREQHLAVERALADRVVGVVGEIDGVVRAHVQAVRARENAFAPGAQEAAFAIVDDHRMRAAVEDVDVVLASTPTPPTSP